MEAVVQRGVFNWKERARAAGLHLCGGLAIAALAGLLVLGVWYPHPYREISGGRELFLLLVTVDVVLGPLTTFAIFDLRKGWRVMRRDLAVIVALQLAALGYGLWTAAQARPVHLVFEKDRLRVVHALEVPQQLLAKTPPGIDARPWTGPTLIAARTQLSPAESLEVTMAEAQGVVLASRPDFWIPFEDAKFEFLTAAKPASVLKQRFPAIAPEVERLASRAGVEPQALMWLPVMSRRAIWTALVDPRGTIVGYLPIDPF